MDRLSNRYPAYATAAVVLSLKMHPLWFFCNSFDQIEVLLIKIAH